MTVCDGIYEPRRAHTSTHSHISTHTKTHVGTQIHAPVTFLFPGMVNMFLVWIRTKNNNTNMYVCIYIDMIVQCLFEKTRACVHTHARARTHTHTHTHTLTCRDWSHEIPPFIDLILHCLLPHCRSLCILADPVVFFSALYLLQWSVSYICFSTFQVFCSFCALVMFFYVFLIYPSLSALLLLWTFLPGNVCACYSVFMCLWPCFHALCDSHSSAWHWGYV